MKRGTFVIASILVFGAVLPSTAVINWSVQTVGATTTYRYFYTNTEETYDIVCGIHVYAPVSASLITGWEAGEGWEFNTVLDYTGALDIYWYTDLSDDYGVSYGQTVYVSFQTHSSVPTVYGYVLPDFLIGNWGYDTKNAGGTWTMFGSVPVPQGMEELVPEPATCLTVLAGCGLVSLLRRR